MMKNIIKLSLIAICCLALPAQLSAKDYPVTEFGAKGDGVTLNTASIQAAIDCACANGGGRVVVPAGEFVCGSIYMKTNVELHLEEGAVLLGSLNPFDYILDPYINWTAFLLAVKQDNISLTGKGVVDCRGFDVANRLVQYIHLGLVEDDLVLDRPRENKRPQDIHFRECTNVTIKDVTLKNPASWTQQYELCENLLIEGIKVFATAYWNNDGLDVVDCRNVVVRNCFIDSADDSYCFKSHHADGLSENILVENCVGRSSANGIKFGTMTVGNFRHFVFRNMKIYDTYRSAITIASVDGGAVEDVVVDGLESIHTGNPIFLRLAKRRSNNNVPCLKDIVIKNVYAEVPFEKPDAGYSYEGPVEDLPRNVLPSEIIGLPDMRIENVLIENVEIKYPGKADKDYAYRGSSPEELAAIPELEKSYPEFSNWKELPAWGFYIRHCDGLTLKNVKISVEGEDYRPAVVSDDVNGMRFQGVQIIQPGADRKKKQIVTNNTRNFKNSK